VSDISALSYPVAFAAGFVSFASPCVLAVVPGYLSFISGVSFDELGARWRDVLAPTLIFVAGFSLMFTAYGASAGLIGYSLTENQHELNLVAGILLILMGVLMVALPSLGLLQTERRLTQARRPTTLVGSALVGAAFAVGWTPCIGPILAAILSIAAAEATVTKGAGLLAVYSLGLGIPFLLAAFMIEQFSSLFARMKRHLDTVERAMGVLMVITGIGFLTGAVSSVSIWLLETFPALQNFG
jgi:cytochrome c-type biogenesis protein